eukprot:scaffold76250_cov27-Tisochrysis_lutea.AAC.5
MGMAGGALPIAAQVRRLPNIHALWQGARASRASACAPLHASCMPETCYAERSGPAAWAPPHGKLAP